MPQDASSPEMRARDRDASDIFSPPIESSLSDEEPAQRPSIVSRLIYLALVVLPVLLVIVVVMGRAGIISTQPHVGKTPWDLTAMIFGAVFVIVVSTLVARRAPDLLARARNPNAIDHVSSQWELRVLIGTLPLAFAILALGFLSWAGIGPLHLSALGPPVLTTVAVLVLCGPVGYFTYARERHINQLEERFPDFLRDLNESYGAGLTMAQAIRVASRGDYGKLNPEIHKMAHQVSWGTPFPEALKMFGERVGTPIITRAVALIIKTSRAGGNAKDVLQAASRDAREIKALQQERALSMTLYVIVIYVAFAVFLGVVAALQGLLVPALLKSVTSSAALPGGGGGIAGVATGNVSLDDFRLIYFTVGLVQAMGSGIVAGVMSEGSYAQGLKHSTILVALSLVVLGLLIH